MQCFLSLYYEQGVCVCGGSGGVGWGWGWGCGYLYIVKGQLGYVCCFYKNLGFHALKPQFGLPYC